jgi:DNA (cytosine-5)-methyltransferase 1
VKHRTAPGAGPRPLAAEFFAGIGLVRQAVEGAGFRVVFANDVEPTKRAMYVSNFGEDDFVLRDVCDVRGGDVPTVELATASFPCTDMSLAGNMRGFRGAESSLFWQFARVLREMGTRRPPVAMLENVPSFATSHGGEDLRLAIEELNDLGYSCDLLVVDAKRFIPQSRPRLFIVAAVEPPDVENEWESEVRPAWVARFADRHPELRMHAAPLHIGPRAVHVLADVVERMRANDRRWWDEPRVDDFIQSLSDLQWDRLEAMRDGARLRWATAYRRTRFGRPVWEVRADDISGCLRTARGGSSKQALVQAGAGRIRVRWMTPLEYARLQGAPDYDFSAVTENQALFGFGDAVCVPAVEWVASEYLMPLVNGRTVRKTAARAASS